MEYVKSMNQVIEVKNPAIERVLYELRHQELQQDRFLYSKNLWLLGVLMGSYMSDFLTKKEVEVESVLGTARHTIPAQPPVLVNILRASSGMVQGNLEVYRDADTTIIAAARDEETLKCRMSYFAINKMEGKDVIVIDPMLATGGTISDVCTVLKDYHPSKILIQSAFAAPEGIARIHKDHPDIPIFTAVIDERLNEKGYIIPGLGDAGDLLYGKKLALEKR